MSVAEFAEGVFLTIMVPLVEDRRDPRWAEPYRVVERLQEFGVVFPDRAMEEATFQWHFREWQRQRSLKDRRLARATMRANLEGAGA